VKRFLTTILSKLVGDPLLAPLSPRHTHALVTRDEMDQHPIQDPSNWLPKKRLDSPIERPHLWKERKHA
jgi:hypothetical protein